MYKFLIETTIPLLHHSIIPSGLHETCSIQNTVISICCRISETLITASALVFQRGSFSLLPFVMALIGLGALHLGLAQALTIQTLVSMGLLISGALFKSRIIGK